MFRFPENHNNLNNPKNTPKSTKNNFHNLYLYLHCLILHLHFVILMSVTLSTCCVEMQMIMYVSKPNTTTNITLFTVVNNALFIANTHPLLRTSR